MVRCGRDGGGGEGDGEGVEGGPRGGGGGCAAGAAAGQAPTHGAASSTRQTAASKQHMLPQRAARHGLRGRGTGAVRGASQIRHRCRAAVCDSFSAAPWRSGAAQPSAFAPRPARCSRLAAAVARHWRCAACGARRRGIRALRPRASATAPARAQRLIWTQCALVCRQRSSGPARPGACRCRCRWTRLPAACAPAPGVRRDTAPTGASRCLGRVAAPAQLSRRAQCLSSISVRGLRPAGIAGRMRGSSAGPDLPSPSLSDEANARARARVWWAGRVQRARPVCILAPGDVPYGNERSTPHLQDTERSARTPWANMACESNAHGHAQTAALPRARKV